MILQSVRSQQSEVLNYTIHDSATGNRFELSEDRLEISAYDKNGKRLWIVNPRLENNLPEYRRSCPAIYFFELGIDRNSDSEVIFIAYTNSQFGYLNKSTGAFTFEGQD
jgi:hypothetical protein